jgi:hypothetical protein
MYALRMIHNLYWKNWLWNAEKDLFKNKGNLIKYNIVLSGIDIEDATKYVLLGMKGL